MTSPAAAAARDDVPDRLVAAIPKNSREEYRVFIQTFRGRRFANLRVWFKAEDGSMRPGKDGLAIKPEALDDLIDALGQARELAREEGLL